MRKLPIIFEPGCSWNRYASGIYKITFGEKFYIGRTYFLFSRWYAHYLDIHKGINGDLPNHKLEFYGSLINYLQENQRIKVGYIQLIKVCQDYQDMCASEDIILRSYKGHPDIVNKNLSSQISPKAAKFMIQLVFKKDKKFFYNPFYKEIFQEGDDVTSLGQKRKRNISNNQRSDDIEYFLALQDYVDKFGKDALQDKLSK